MSTDQIVLFALFGAVFALLLWGRFRYDLVAFSALLVGVLAGVVPAGEAFSGFGHPATVIVALVLVVSAGLVRSGAVLMLTRALVDSGRSLAAHIAVMGGIGAVLSAFMNNVAALALLMPIDIATANKAGRSPAASLMPLSFATILGGMVTMIGTPPNIIVASIRAETLGAPFAMFDFAPVGGLVAVAGLGFVALVGWRLIPAARLAPPSGGEGAPHVAELVVPEGSALIGRRLAELEDEAERAEVSLIGLVRGKDRFHGVAANRALKAGDVLLIEAAPAAIDEFRAALKLDFAEGARLARLEGRGVRLIEAVVPPGARIEGRTATGLGLAWRKGAILIGIARAGARIRTRVRRTRVEAGDTLLLLVPEGQEAEVVSWLGVLAVADRAQPALRPERAWVATGLFAGGVALAASGLASMPVALGLVVVAYVLIGVVPLADLYDHVEWPVVVLLGSMIPLGAALDAAGGTHAIAASLTSLAAGFAPWVALTLLMVVTMTLSDVLNNTATTIVAAPVGIEMARMLGVSADPFLMAVAVAASCAFLTPIGHKNNTLILGPGGYRFADYWRMGLPLELLVVAVSVPAILFFWPL